MIKLTLTNRRTFISGIDREAVRALEAVTSYRVAGFQFAPSFRARRWDGKEHLLSYSMKDGYNIPSGLVLDVIGVLKRLKRKCKVVDRTVTRNKRVEVAWNDSIHMRDYQLAAVRAVLGKPLPGIGILKMPIRSGKTKTAAWLIQRIGRPTLFIVPSLSLLRQTYKALREALPDVDIGIIGEGEYNPSFITVATIQTLSSLRGRRANGKKKGKKADPRYKALLTMFDVVICDEAHHLRGEGEWYRVMYEMDARYKIALSATVYLDNDSENERGIIWLKACCGPIRIDIGTSELVEAGYLMRQNVMMLRITKPDLNDHRWSQTLWRLAINENKDRNRLIAKVARIQARLGRKILIIARRLNHIDAICEMLDTAEVDYRVITGKTSGDDREDLVDGLARGDFSVLIGTVIGEGVDIPSVECVINAEGGSDVKTTVQRQRNLTISEGKSTAIFIDFFDDTNPYFRKHSVARLEAYKAETSFNVRVVG